jgi:uncharacterized protein YwqG
MDKADVEAAFVAAGLSRLLKDIDRVSKASISLYATRVDESTLNIGASKLGGVPDLPEGVSWPEWKGLPQSFIAQIHLADVVPYDADKLLPHSGMLWFFYDAQQQTFGADPTDRGGWRVIFREGDQAQLHRTPAPAALPAASQFHACSLSFASEITLSQQPQLEIPTFDWTADEQKKYEALLSTFPTPTDHGAPHHRLLGFPNTIQDDMRLECQLASQGVTDMNDPRISELSKGAMNWQLLLQVDSDERAGMRWADAGILYYWMKQADLQSRDFDESWLVLQSD